MAFDQGNSAGNKIVSEALQSPNYAQGSSGWTINRDGSAEFQNVLVRGTITGSTIIGSTIIGGTITGGIFKSSNFDNTAHTGFEINATGSPDATATPPVPANTAQWYNNFYVGPTTGNYLALAYNGTAAAVQLFTGNPADSGSAAGMGVDTVAIGTHTVSELALSTALGANGAGTLLMQNSGGTAATDAPLLVKFGTSGVTAPVNVNGVQGKFALGGQVADVWQCFINNENSVITAGGALNNPGLVIGNTFTPQSRLFVSVNEILSVNGVGAIEPLYLNQDSGAHVGGGLVSQVMRQQSTTAGLVAAFTPPVALTQVSAITGVRCPTSGTITVWLKFAVLGNSGLTAPDFVFGAVQVDNVTQGTTPFAASANRGAQVTGPFLLGTVGSPQENTVTVMTQITATGLGNDGDNLTISAWFQNNSNAAGRFFNVNRGELGYNMSL